MKFLVDFCVGWNFRAVSIGFSLRFLLFPIPFIFDGLSFFPIRIEVFSNLFYGFVPFSLVANMRNSVKFFVDFCVGQNFRAHWFVITLFFLILSSTFLFLQILSRFCFVFFHCKQQKIQWNSQGIVVYDGFSVQRSLVSIIDFFLFSIYSLSIHMSIDVSSVNNYVPTNRSICIKCIYRSVVVSIHRFLQVPFVS